MAERPQRPAAAGMRLWAIVAAALLLVAGAACTADDASGAPTTTTTAAAPPTGPVTVEEAEGPDDGDGILRVLLTNDDGYDSPGLEAMARELLLVDSVIVVIVAPLGQQSGQGGNFTDGPVASEMRTTDTGREVLAVDGRPADAVRVAFEELDDDFDIVVSGINDVQNLGTFVDLSGTIGAARAGVARGIPALAVSADINDPPFRLAAVEAVEWILERLDDILRRQQPVEVTSLNVPSCPTDTIRGIVEVPVATDNEPSAFDPVDCEAAHDDDALADDVSAFLLGYATLTVVPDEPATPPEAFPPDA